MLEFMQITTSSNLEHIANLVVRYLRKKKRHAPSLLLLRQLIETAFYASMKTEESRHVICTLILVDSRNPAGKNPPFIRPQRRSYVAFKDMIPFDVRNLVKLSQAAPPWASSIAICTKKGQLFVCGLFDQEVHHRNSLNREEGDRFGRPGILQIELTGVASVAVHDDSSLIATLNQNTLVTTFHDVFKTGPIAKILYNLALKQMATVRKILQEKDKMLLAGTWEAELYNLWVRTLSRILLNIRRSGHGGALLLVSSTTTSDLKIKYAIKYPKLEAILPQHIANEIQELAASENIHDEFLDMDKDEIPVGLHLAETIAAYHVEDAVKAELGCVNFIASLARVDGCVLLTSGLNVEGFGAEITCRNDPVIVYTALDELATKLRPLDFKHFGTRHRSMMRYCLANPGSVGFVVSQDGDVRAITLVGKKLVLWENVRLQNVEIVKHRAAKNKNRNRG